MIRAFEGRIGPREFAAMTPAQVWGLYFRPRDEEGKLIRQPQHKADRPITPPIDLGIPQEAYDLDMMLGPQGGNVGLFWSVERAWRKRTVAETMAKWREYVKGEVEHQAAQALKKVEQERARTEALFRRQDVVSQQVDQDKPFNPAWEGLVGVPKHAAAGQNSGEGQAPRPADAGRKGSP